MAWKGGIRPIHDSLQSVGTTGTHTSFYSGYNSSNKAYIELEATVPASFKTQGYQYVLTGGAVNVSSVTFDELIVSADDLTQSAHYLADENIIPSDDFFTIPDALISESLISDVLSQSVNLLFDESILVSDEVVPGNRRLESDSALVSDTLSQSIHLYFNEFILGSDSVSAIRQAPLIEVINYHSVVVQSQQAFVDCYTVKPQVSRFFDDAFSVGVPVAQNSLVAVTNATSVTNPFAGTLVVNGTVLYSGLGNPPPVSVANTSLYFKYLNAGISNISLCDIFNFGVSFDYDGGSFSVTSLSPLASATPQLSLGSVVEFFGFEGGITDSGRVKNSSQVAYTSRGIFGPLIMHQQFGQIMSGNVSVKQVVSTQRLTLPVLTDKITVAGAARAVVSQVSRHLEGPPITLHWAVQDAPYDNTLSESGLTGLEALQQLASRASGTVRWDGNRHYTIAYPDVCFGNWTVPDCSLIGAGGLEYSYHLDLGTGLSGTGIVIVPVSAQFEADKIELPATTPAQGGKPTVNQFAKIKQVLTSDDPPLVYDLPQDFDEVYIQILVPANGSTGGTNQVNAINNYCTKNPSDWFVFNVAALSGVGVGTEYIFYSDIGGVTIPQVKIDHKVFPTGNSSVDAGNFIMSLAVTRKGLGAAFDQAQAESDNNQRSLQEWNVQNYKFVKTFSGTIQCMFFGSIPLPGMCASATVGDMTVDGVIESVQFSYPGFITVQVAKYIRLNMMKPPYQWDSSSKTLRPNGGPASG